MLIAVVGVISVIQTKMVADKVEYLTKNIANKVNMAGELEATILSIRASVEQYIYRNAEVSNEQAEENIEKATELISFAEEWIKEEGDLETVKEIKTLLDEYVTKYRNVVIRLKARKDNIHSFDNSGEKILDQIFRYLQEIPIVKTTGTSSNNILTNFLLAKIEIKSYFIDNELIYSDNALNILKNVFAEIKTEGKQHKSDLASIQKHHEEILWSVEEYMDSFESIVALDKKLFSEIEQTLFPYAPKIIDLAVSISDSGWFEMGTARLETEGQVKFTIRVIVSLTIAAIIMGIIIAILSTRAIIKAENSLRTANASLQDAEAKTRSLLESSPDLIINVDRDYKILYMNRSISPDGSSAEIDPAIMFGLPLIDLCLPEYQEAIKQAVKKVFETGKSDIIETHVIANEKISWFENRFAAIEANEKVVEVMVIASDITQRKTTEATLVATQKELVEKAHQAGMADIATGTLHNIGNILNSVLTSVQIMREIQERSNIAKLSNANNLLKENIDTIEQFICEDPKGKKLLQYYLKIEEGILDEHNTFKEHLVRLNNKTDAITAVISAQQSYAGTTSLTESFDLSQIIEDALTMQGGTLERYNISVTKDFKTTPEIPVQKMKLVHIIVNLIQNAKDAMLETEAEERKLHFAVNSNDSYAYIKVTDNGPGIPKEQQDKIFVHGFTTKKTGHGFGLHSCANYMTEMRGKLWVESEGNGLGATFIMEFSLS